MRAGYFAALFFSALAARAAPSPVQQRDREFPGPTCLYNGLEWLINAITVVENIEQAVDTLFSVNSKYSNSSSGKERLKFPGQSSRS